MKSKLKRGLGILLSLVMVFALSSTSNVQTNAAGKVALSKKKVSLAKGKTVTLKLKNAKASKIKWSSSNKSVATVKKGKVKAKKAGKAVIKATYKKKTYKCNITVTGDITILFTSDVHCGIDQGFGYAGLYDIRENLKSEGKDTLLVDDGDAIQGDVAGTYTKGEAIVDIMNTVGYDLAIPGNHEFDYGMDNFLSLAKKAKYQYLSVNFNKKGKTVFEPYVIKDLGGRKIAFVGMTTPKTITSSTPKYFQDDQGNFIYGFMQENNGKDFYKALQNAIDSAKAKGAEYVIAMGHLGNEASCHPFTYEDVIVNVSGLDAFLDGHSHDTDKVMVKDKSGKKVLRVACGTKFAHIGHLDITADGKISAGLYDWDEENPTQPSDSVAKKKVDEIKAAMDEELNKVVGHTDFDLVINDPVNKTPEGKAIRLVRRAETNLADLCADAVRDRMEADIGIVNGGGVRADIPAGDITARQIFNVHPFNNDISMIEVTGQQILDALEWGVRVCPEESGGFLHVSGLTFEVNTEVKSPVVADENDMYVKVEGERRVKNVKVGGTALDPAKTYSLAGINYILINEGNGFTMFNGAKVLRQGTKVDNQLLMEYISEDLGGVIPNKYKDPYGEGRIVAVTK